MTREQLRRCRSKPHAQHGQWNYTIAPTGGAGRARSTPRSAPAPGPRPCTLLADERLTGMSRDELAALAHALAPAQASAEPRNAASNNAVDDAAGHPARAARACSPAPTGC